MIFRNGASKLVRPLFINGLKVKSGNERINKSLEKRITGRKIKLKF